MIRVLLVAIPAGVHLAAAVFLVAWLRARFRRLRPARAWLPVATALLVMTFFPALAALGASVLDRRNADDSVLVVAGLMALTDVVLTAAALAIAGWEIVLAIGAGLARLVAGRRRLTPDGAATPNGTDDVDRRRALAQIGGGVAVTAATIPLGWGMARTRFDVEVVEMPIRLARLPKALDGYSIVQVSDIHIGPFFGERSLAHAEEIVARLRPDLVAMTGDLVYLRNTWLATGVAWVARLGARARHGATAVPGNHEYYAGREEAMEALASAGVDVLFNRGRVVAPGDDGGFGLVGVDDLFGPLSGLGPGPRVEGALASLPPDLSRVLLCHQPQYVERAASYGFDLQLSGHTHGGQIAPVGPILCERMFRVVAGYARVGGCQLYVNRGLGTSGPPTRVAVRPEITKVVLVSA